MPVASGGFEQCLNAEAVVAVGNLLVVAVNVMQAPYDKQQVEPMLGNITALPDDFGKIDALLTDHRSFSDVHVNACAAAGTEPVFGIIKSVLGFHRFQLRGLDQVRSAWSLVTMAWTMKRMFVLGNTISGEIAPFGPKPGSLAHQSAWCRHNGRRLDSPKRQRPCCPYRKTNIRLEQTFPEPLFRQDATVGRLATA